MRLRTRRSTRPPKVHAHARAQPSNVVPRPFRHEERVAWSQQALRVPSAFEQRMLRVVGGFHGHSASRERVLAPGAYDVQRVQVFSLRRRVHARVLKPGALREDVKVRVSMQRRGRVFCTDPRIHGAVLRGEPSEDVHGHGEQPLERRDLVEQRVLTDVSDVDGRRIGRRACGVRHIAVREVRRRQIPLHERAQGAHASASRVTEAAELYGDKPLAA
mmetsp:Transcript_5426/g.19582  ORF Transcript_5426/g.19582 Transcript_5426/m.19582 type:complete len:217 (-) Transcript_5426:1656-2306(-)